MTIELGARTDSRSWLWRRRDAVGAVLHKPVLRRRYQIQELRDELAELHVTVHRLTEIIETVVEALARDQALD
jgi:hypothetical protein